MKSFDRMNRIRASELCLFCAILLAGAPACPIDLIWQGSAQQIPGGSSGGNFYDYAASSILDNGVEYYYYCTNRDSGVVRDHIGLTQVRHSDGVLLSPRQIVLGPSSDGLWQHVAGVWDGPSNTLRVFVNGVQLNQAIEAEHPNLKAFGGFRVIGGSLNPADRQTFNGKIDEFRVSKVARDIAASTAWMQPYAADADTVDLYHFDLATDPAVNPTVFDSAAPQQNGHTFDFSSPGSDQHIASRTGFGECHNYGNSTPTGSRSEFFPDSPGHDVLSDRVTIEAWINPHHVSGNQTIFDSQSARLRLVNDTLEFSVFFSDESSLSVAASGAVQSAFDKHHACDPDVIKGQFLFGGTTYSWAMFYLGEDSAPGSCMHNQIGIAFADDPAGPWVKWPGNPIVPFESYDYWGIGQSSAVSIDCAGHLYLFYSRGDQFGTRMVRRELNLADMDSPKVGPEVLLPKDGLTSIDGSPVIFHNASIVYDSVRDMFFTCRPRHPFDSTTPDFISSQMQIACIEGDAIRTGIGTWEVLGHIDSTLSGRPRNHNCGILQDGYGKLPNASEITVAFAISVEGGGWLWSYRLYKITGELTGLSVPNCILY